MGPDEGAQMAMMANMMGDSMRIAVKTAAVSTAKEVAEARLNEAEAQVALAQDRLREGLAVSAGDFRRVRHGDVVGPQACAAGPCRRRQCEHRQEGRKASRHVARSGVNVPMSQHRRRP
jgi:hypothetical protein